MTKFFTCDCMCESHFHKQLNFTSEAWLFLIALFLTGSDHLCGICPKPKSLIYIHELTYFSCLYIFKFQFDLETLNKKNHLMECLLLNSLITKFNYFLISNFLLRFWLLQFKEFSRSAAVFC